MSAARMLRWSGLAGVLALVAGNLVFAAPAAVAATGPCGTDGNAIACENSLPGSPPSEWDDMYGAGDEAIQGFSTDISVNVGSRVDFKIDTAASAYTITIYRTGYYGGDGARRITSVTPSASLPQHQPQCISDVATELYDCGNWAVSASWNVPSTAVSGVYIAKLEIPSTGERSHITFVVRNDASHSELIFQTSDPTWQAYNTYGGSDFYQGAANGRAYKVSYNRPVLTRSGTGGRDFYFANEYPMVRFLERNGYDVSYQAGVDTDRRGNLLTNHETFLSVGHDEYWSGAQRANIEAARAAGVNLQFLSGNEGYWRTRYEPSADSSHTAYRTLVSYKETWDYDKIDPAPEWTGTWRDPRYAPTSQGAGRPENALTGQLYMVNHDDLAVTVNANEGKLRLWRNTSLASLPVGGSAALTPHTVGYESDEDIDNGHRPAGLIRLSTTNGPTPEYLTDFGNTVVPGTTTHHLTMYRANSGALVFAAGTVQWTWGLDAEHDTPFAPVPADARMQQAQVNLLADMGAQPTTLMAGLVKTTKSTDTVGPTATVSTPASGSSQNNGSTVTVTGTATDAGGGRVAGVEVSTDDGATWHPANGTSSWTYSYNQTGVGASSIRVRATDDSANIGAVTSRPVTVSCPCSVFGATVPATPAADDGTATELGLRFTPTQDGFVSGVRFYKGAGNTGSHVGSLWSAAGERLASVPFTGETATGWQKASFTVPVAVSAGQTYVVSYTAPNGRYAVQANAFYAAPLVAAPLTVPGGFGATPSGVYANAGVFPNESYRSSNYFVDPVFTLTDSSPMTLLDRWPTPDASSVARTTVVRARYSKPITAGSAALTLKDSNGATVAGTTTYDASTRTVTFTPSAQLAGFVRYTATVTGTDTQGGPVSSGGTWSFRTAQPPGAPGVCPCSLFDEDLTPSVLDVADNDPVTLGVRFTTDVAGTVSALRFYKGPGNTGSHQATLWRADGTQLAQGTFTNESSTGWQTFELSTPVAITAGTEYVASYRAPNGHYSATPGAFTSSALSKAPIQVAAQAGSYTYGTGFPSSRSTSNYLVDVVFNRPAPTIAVSATDPPSGAVDVERDRPVKVWFTVPIQSGASLTASVGGSPVSGTMVLSADAKMLSFTPSSPLPEGSVVTMTLSGVRSTDGAQLAAQSWTFTTVSAGAPPQTLFGDTVPVVGSEDDSSPVEVGTAFQPTRDGVVKAIRFHKGPGNGGTHVGSLWSPTGQRMATVTFANETPSGWQSASLTTPVRLTAGTTYVVSYLAPQGHYSYTSGFFNNPWTSGQLVAPAGDNGRYLYGAAGGMPVYSWGSTNYFVDVKFVPDPAAVSITARTPAPGTTGVSLDARPSVSFSAAISDGASLTVSQGSSPVPGTAALSADRKKLTFTPSGPLPADTDLTVRVANVQSTEGAALPADSWTIHTEAAVQTVSASLLTGQTPANASVDDSDPVELGTAFTPAVAGQVTAIRFYKGAGNTGTHVGSVWSAAGDRLATVTFEDETSTGWQTATLSTPLQLSAGTTYVVSYYAPNGHYAATSRFFEDGWTSGPLSAPSTDNGRFRYAGGGGFPTASWNASNYFVDVVFRYAAS